METSSRKANGSRFRMEDMGEIIKGKNDSDKLGLNSSKDRKYILFLSLTFVLLTIASCPFHGWQSFQSFILGHKQEDDLPATLEKVYTWGSSLEMIIGLLAGAALDIFGPSLTSLIGLVLFHFSCLALVPLMILRSGALGEGMRLFLLRHQGIAMLPWNLVLACMFTAPNFTSMGWFLLRNRIKPYRLSALVAGTQYLSSMVATGWWLMGERLGDSNWLILLIWCLLSCVVAMLWISNALRMERAEVTTSPQSGKESIELSWIKDGNPLSLWNSFEMPSADLPLGWLKLPTPREYSPSKIYFFHLTNGFIQIIRSTWLSLFTYWYSTNIFLMTYYDSRFRSMLLASVYADHTDLPKKLIVMSSLMTILQAPLCFAFGESISRASSRQKTFIVAVLCLSCSLLYAFAFIFLTHFPYCSVVCNGIAGAFVYGSKYWFTDACISGNLITTGVEQYGVITGTLQLVAGVAALLNLIPTTGSDSDNSMLNLQALTFHSIASAIALSGLIPCIILIIMLWTKKESTFNSMTLSLSQRMEQSLKSTTTVDEMLLQHSGGCNDDPCRSSYMITNYSPRIVDNNNANNSARGGIDGENPRWITS